MKKLISYLTIGTLILSVSFVSCKNEDGCKYSKYKSVNGCICIMRDNQGNALRSCSKHEENIMMSNVVMFPNPASNCIYLEMKTVPRTVVIKNSGGKELYRQTTNNYCLVVDISDFRDGTYLVTVDDGTQKSKLCLFKNSGEPCH